VRLAAPRVVYSFLSCLPVHALLGGHSVGRQLCLPTFCSFEDEVEALRRITSHRVGGAIDVVLISGRAVFPIEFKCGKYQFRRAGYQQSRK
jgi:hypothetical protein